MKYLILTALVALLCVTGFNSAFAKSYGGAGGVKPTAEGTISDVGSKGFTMKVANPAAARKKTDDAPAADAEKTIMVQCDNNTKFQTGDQPADGSIIKAGAHVAVFGSTSGENTIMAQKVSLVSEHKKK
jgi:hypothetical protein